MFSTARPRRMTDEGEDRGSAVRQEEIPPEASQARDRGSEEEQGEASLEGAMETSKAVACRSPLVTVSSPIHSSVYHKAEKLTFRVWCFGFCVFVGFFKAEWHFIFKRKTVYSSICCNFDLGFSAPSPSSTEGVGFRPHPSIGKDGKANSILRLLTGWGSVQRLLQVTGLERPVIYPLSPAQRPSHSSPAPGPQTHIHIPETARRRSHRPYFAQARLWDNTKPLNFSNSVSSSRKCFVIF